MADGPATTRRRRKPRPDPAPTSSDPLDIAMDLAAKGAAVDSPAQRLLVNQNRLVGWQIAGERAGFALKVGLGALGLAAVLVLVGMVWSASHAHGVVIRAFTVPPQMAANGVSGDVLAAEFLDHINVQQAAAIGTAVKRSTVAGITGEGLRLEIPQTGISVGELYRTLRGWLGHDSVISGALTQDGETLTLTARLQGQPPVTVTGPASDRPALVRAAAEQIFAQADPVRAVFYLTDQGRTADVDAILTRIRSVGTPAERADGFSFSGARAIDPYQQVLYASQGIVIDPNSPMAYNSLSIGLLAVGRWQDSRQANRDFLAHLKRARDVDFGEGARPRLLANSQATEAFLTGDYGEARRLAEGVGRDVTNPRFNPETDIETYAALNHDIGLADMYARRAALRQADTPALRAARARVDLAAERWPEAVVELEAAVAEATPKARLRLIAELAVAKAHAGDAAGAAAVLAPTPLDSYPCLRARGVAAALAGDAAGADRWFAQAVQAAPSLPQAQAEWARALLDRGDTTRALAQARAARLAGPRFADALSLEGEALLVRGDAKGAEKAFAAAAKLAPAWGRNERLWGDALAKLGKTSQAQAHWRTAKGLNLTPAERAQLAAAH